jgi:capsular exopolysaccharide synthesis family protein
MQAAPNEPDQDDRMGYRGSAYEDEGISIDFGRIFGALRKYFWVVLLFLVAGAIAAVTYLNVATPIYQSFALLKVEQRVMDAAPGMGMMADTSEDLRALDMLGTIQRGFLSRSLMERITDKLRLVDREEFLGDVPADERTMGRCVSVLINNTEATVIRGTRLMQISFDHSNENIATEVTAALVREYIALDGEQRLNSAGTNVSYLMNERDGLEKKLRDSEQKLAEYAQQLGSVSVDNELNIIAQQLLELNSRLTVTKADRLKLESDFEQVRAVQDDPRSLLQIASVAQLPEIQALRAQLNGLDGTISAQRQRYGARNPAIMELVSQRTALQEALDAEALRAPRTLEISLRAALQNEKSLERETQAQEKKTLNVKDLAIQSSVLQRQIDADNLAFTAVLQRLNMEMTQARSQPIFLQVVDPASPAMQVKPRSFIAIALAAFASLSLAGGTIFLIAILDTSIKSVDEAERLLGLPVLAAIPEMSKAQRRREVRESKLDRIEREDGGVRLPLLEDKHSTVSEAFRTLRASVLLLEGSQQRVLFTSAVPGEGKSFCSLNAAVALAQQDANVLLIDADLRKPTLEKRLFDGERAVGLADFLSGSADFDEIIRPSPVPGLSVITAGKRHPNPAELLSRKERVADLLRQAEGRFDRVVMDSAPVLAVSDTLNLVTHFNSVALVVRSHKTGRRFIQRALDLLARSGRPARGIAMNLVPAKGASYYYYYSHGKGGAVYGDTSDTPPDPAVRPLTGR